MLKLTALPSFAATIAVVSLAGLLPAQRPSMPSSLPSAPPGVPMTAPPIDHPALAAQPLFNEVAKRRPAGGSARPAGPAGPSAPKAKPVDPGTMGPKLAGKDLKKAVAKVTALKWNESLAEARVQAAANGKPILWIQALGDIDGFA